MRVAILITSLVWNDSAAVALRRFETDQLNINTVYIAIFIGWALKYMQNSCLILWTCLLIGAPETSNLAPGL